MKKIILPLIFLQMVQLSYSEPTSSDTEASVNENTNLSSKKQEFEQKIKEIVEKIKKLLEKDTERETEEFKTSKASVTSLLEEIKSLLAEMNQMTNNAEEELSKEAHNYEIINELVSIIFAKPSTFRNDIIENNKDKINNNTDPYQLEDSKTLNDFYTETLNKLKDNDDEVVKKNREQVEPKGEEVYNSLINYLEEIVKENPDNLEEKKKDLENKSNELLNILSDLQESRFDSTDEKVKKSNQIYEISNSILEDTKFNSYTMETEEKITKLEELDSTKGNKIKELYNKYIAYIIKKQINSSQLKEEIKQEFIQKLDTASNDLEEMKKIKVEFSKIEMSYDKLEKLIEKANNLKNEKSYENATEEEKREFDEALEEAESKKEESSNITSENLDQIIQKLSNSINNLSGDPKRNIDDLYIDIANEIYETGEMDEGEQLEEKIKLIEQKLNKYLTLLNRLDPNYEESTDKYTKKVYTIYLAEKEIYNSLKNPSQENIDSSLNYFEKILDVYDDGSSTGNAQAFISLLLRGPQGIRYRIKKKQIENLKPLRIEIAKLVNKYVSISKTEEDEEELSEKEIIAKEKEYKKEAYSKLRELEDKIKEIDNLGLKTNDTMLKDAINSYNSSYYLLEAKGKKSGERTEELRKAEEILLNMSALSINTSEDEEEKTDRELLVEAYEILTNENDEVLVERFSELEQEVKEELENLEFLNEHQKEYYNNLIEKNDDERNTFDKIARLKMIRERMNLANDRMKNLREEVAKGDRVKNSNPYKNSKQEDKDKYNQILEEAKTYNEENMSDVEEVEIDKDALKSIELLEKLKLYSKIFEKIDLSKYINKVELLHSIDSDIISNFDRKYYSEIGLGINFKDVLENKEKIDINKLIGNLKFGFNYELYKDLYLGSFIEYKSEYFHNLGIGINAKYSINNNDLLSFVRYRYVFRDEIKMNAVDIFFKYGYKIKINDFNIEPNVSILANYSTKVILDKNVQLNDLFKANISLSTNLKYTNNEYKFDIYVNPKIDLIFNTKEIISQINDEENTLILKKKPIKFDIAVGGNKKINDFLLGLKLQLNNERFKTSINFSYNK